jgi:hypothetical protein
VSPLGRFGEFLEGRTDARPLAVARLIIGGAAFLRGLVSYHLFDLVLTPGVIRARAFEWIPDMTRGAMPWYIGVWLFVSAAFALGYRTRLNGSILVALIVYHLAADLNFFWSHVYFLGCLISLLTAANAGADLSFDWIGRGGGRKTVPRWGVVLLKLHVSIVYLVAALVKLIRNTSQELWWAAAFCTPSSSRHPRRWSRWLGGQSFLKPPWLSLFGSDRCARGRLVPGCSSTP